MRTSTTTPPAADGGSVTIRDVWAHNLEYEADLICQCLKDYPYVAIDTEFPGTVVTGPKEDFRGKYRYSTIKENINLTKLIQLGITIGDDQGNLPKCGTNQSCVWQFNFRDFNIRTDLIAPASFKLLRQSGIHFDRFANHGVSLKAFAETMMMSGVFSNVFVRLIIFHGASDFGYLIKCLRGEDLPESYERFLELVEAFFPDFVDVKHLANFTNNQFGGLQQMADNMGLKRVGTAHLAGSDSLLTFRVFLKLKELCFPDGNLPVNSLNVISSLDR